MAETTKKWSAVFLKRGIVKKPTSEDEESKQASGAKFLREKTGQSGNTVEIEEDGLAETTRDQFQNVTGATACDAEVEVSLLTAYALLIDNFSLGHCDWREKAS